MNPEDLYYTAISIMLAAGAFITIRVIINKKLKHLVGVQKITGLFSLFVIVRGIISWVYFSRI